MRRDQLPRGTLRRSFVLPRWKTVYVPTPKAGATSLMSMGAELLGAHHGRFRTAEGARATRAQNIHDRRLWRRTPRLEDLSDHELEEISPENGWLIFAVVRNPMTRLWSAWQSKLLLREAFFVARFGDRVWFPRVPHSLDEVREDFARFTTALVEEPGLVDADMHWRLQSVQVDTRAVPFTHVGRLEEFRATREVFTLHLRELGWAGSFEPHAENETPLPLTARFLSDAAVQAVDRAYRVDFEQFGYASVVPADLPPLPDIELALLGEIGRLVGRAERIGDLSAQLQRTRAPVTAARKFGHQAASALRQAGRRVHTTMEQRRGRPPPNGTG